MNKTIAKLTIMIAAAMLLSTTTHAAGVAINETGDQPAASAMLDVQNSTKGFLPPRMTAAQKNAISAPATGLMIYQTDGTAGLYTYNGTSWSQVGVSAVTSIVTLASICEAITAGGADLASFCGPTVSTTGGAIFAPTSRTVVSGNTTTFTVTPGGSRIVTVTGCGGSLSGNIYTTGPVTASCTIKAIDNSNAITDMKAIQNAMMMFRYNTGVYPNRTNGTDWMTNTIQVLASDGNAIADLATKGWDGPSNHLLGYLRTNDNGYPVTGATAWKGSYLVETPADPWGNRYYVGAKNFEDTSGLALPVWIISAGPNGIIDTHIDSQVCFDGVLIDPATSAVTLSSDGKPADDICLRFFYPAYMDNNDSKIARATGDIKTKGGSRLVTPSV